LQPVSTESVEISTNSLAIPTHSPEKQENKKVNSVISPSCNEISTESTETSADNSPTLGESNNTSCIKRKHSDPELSSKAVSLIHKKRKNTISAPGKIFHKKMNSDSEMPSQGGIDNLTNSSTISPTNQPFSFDMDFTPTVDTPAWARVFQQQINALVKQNQEQDQRLEDLMESNRGMQQLIEELSSTKALLEKVTAERDALKHQLSGTSASIHAPKEGRIVVNKDNENNGDKEPAQELNHGKELIQNQVSEGEFPALGDTQGTYAKVAAATANQQVRRRRVTQGQRRAAARVFSEPSGEIGFQTVYLPCRRRMPISELRGNLRKLKITNYRVLDVSYPAHKVVALLVHKEYGKELLERFETAGVKPVENFDPLDAKVLNDPKWANSSEAERKTEAIRLQRIRCLVALDHIRIPARFAVARHFVQLGWVESEVLQAIQTGEPLAPPRQATDQVMGDVLSVAANAFRADSVTPASPNAAATVSSRDSSPIPTDADSGRSDE
jgi:hypothetical protein